MDLILLGPPGSGKGTQASFLAKKFNLAYFSTGNFARLIASKKSAKGKRAREALVKGQLIANEIVDGYVAESILGLSPQRGFILDGYPRDFPQALFLEKILAKAKRKNLRVIYLDLGKTEAIKRLSRRLFCSRCGTSYIKDSLKNNLCPNCGAVLRRRADDNPKVIEKRLVEYLKKTKPVLDYFKKKGILKIVNGNQSIEDVFVEILRKIADG